MLDIHLIPDNDLVARLRGRDSDDQQLWYELLEYRVKPVVLGICTRFASHLGRDLEGDVLAETGLAVILRIGDFDPDRGEFTQFVFGLGLNAVRRITSAYDHHPASWYRDNAVTIVDIDSKVAMSEAAVIYGALPDTYDLDLSVALSTADETVSKAVDLVTEMGLSWNEIARRLGLDRKTLTRRVRKWYDLSMITPTHSGSGAE